MQKLSLKAIQMIAVAVCTAILVIYIMRSCAPAPEGTIREVVRWVDRDSIEHVTQPTTEKMDKETKTYTKETLGVSKPSVTSVTGISVQYVCDSARIMVLTDSLINLLNLAGKKSGDTIYIPARTIKDSLLITHYFRKRQLLVDVRSEKGTITAVKSYAVYKEPRLHLGPSFTATFVNGKPAVIPGFSLVYSLRIKRKR